MPCRLINIIKDNASTEGEKKDTLDMFYKWCQDAQWWLKFINNMTLNLELYISILFFYSSNIQIFSPFLYLGMFNYHGYLW